MAKRQFIHLVLALLPTMMGCASGWDRSTKESQFRSLAERQPIGVLCLLAAEISKTVSFAVWLTIVSLAATLSSGLLPCLVPSAKYIWP